MTKNYSPRMSTMPRLRNSDVEKSIHKVDKELYVNNYYKIYNYIIDYI